MSVSIIMPCYNEGIVIEKVVRTYYDEIASKIDPCEFIVIDDCSKDNTWQILESLRLSFPKLKILRNTANQGHGKTIRFGYEEARNDFIFQVDSDNEYDPRDFWNLYRCRDKYDVILGFRKLRQAPLSRLILTRSIRLVNFFLFGVWIRDANCPFRLIRKKTLIELMRLVSPDALAPNILFSVLAKKKQISMTEIPVTHHGRKTGIISIAGWKLIKFSHRGLRQLVAFRQSLKKQLR